MSSKHENEQSQNTQKDFVECHCHFLDHIKMHDFAHHECRICQKIGIHIDFHCPKKCRCGLGAPHTVSEHPRFGGYPDKNGFVLKYDSHTNSVSLCKWKNPNG